MKLVEKHIFNSGNQRWKSLDNICFLSKNLYNQALYRLKQYYENENKYVNYYALNKELLNENQIDYRSLPAHSAQQTLMLLDKNFKSFFKSIQAYKKKPSKFKNVPKPPNYKNKIKGRNIVIFTKNQFTIKDGYIHFTKKSNLTPLKTKQTNINQVRIIPKSTCYVIEIVYTVNPQDLKLNKENYIGIDLGVNTLAAIQSNQRGLRPLLINGGLLKSVNQFYNKKKAYLQKTLVKGKYISKNILRLTLKRNNVIQNYMHHVSKYIIQYCIENDIGNIVIGMNNGWKQNVNNGKKNNQNFVFIPFNTLIQQILYKSKMVGIDVICHEESYTSLCSAFDSEKIGKHVKYIGKRIKRGLFKMKDGFLINADVNGATNILRKVIGNGFISGLNRDDVASPIRINPLINCIQLA